VYQRIPPGLDVRLGPTTHLVSNHIPYIFVWSYFRGAHLGKTEGDVWRDPPHYWEKVVWPAYIRAHKHMFEGEDVMSENLSGKVKELMLFESTEEQVKVMVNTVMEQVLDLSAGKEK
jgi:nicotinamide/nicotinate riboside kinase